MKFINRVSLAHSLGSIVKFNNRYISLPLYHKRPPSPFRPRFSKCKEMDEFMLRLMGRKNWWAARSRGKVSSESVLKRIAIREELAGYRMGKPAEYVVTGQQSGE